MLRTLAVLAIGAGLIAPADDAVPAGGPLLPWAGEPGELPEGWFVSTDGYAAALDEAGAAWLRNDVEQPEVPFGNLMTHIHAVDLRGKTVRLTARLRVDGATDGDRAQMWFRVDRANGEMGFFDNMGDRPVTGDAWTDVEIVGDVADDAKALALGFMLLTRGTLRVDDVALTVAHDVVAPTVDPPAPLSGRALDNCVAFARLLGLVRHFHPSDQAAAADWDLLAVEGMRRVEGCATAGELADVLEAFLAPVAPAVRVFVEGEPEPVPLPDDTEGMHLLAWEHRGFGHESSGIYGSERVEGDPEAGILARLVGRRSADDVPDPAEPYQVLLGSGVAARVPLSVWADDDGTWPRPPTGIALERPRRFTAEDRATRLGAVALAWNVFQHFYPYFDVVDTDWPAVLRASLAAAAEDAGEADFAETLERLVAALHDGHGRVSHPEVGDGGALPLQWEWIEDEVVVVAVADHGTGIEPGDVVESIDGTDVHELVASMAQRVSAATPGWRRLRALGRLRTGEPGRAVVLGMRRGERRGTAELAYRIDGHAVEEPRPAPIDEIEPGVVYVDVSRIDDEDLQGALDRLAAARRIVFDFRGYPSRLRPFSFLPYLIENHATSAQWHTPRITRPDRTDLAFTRGGEWVLAPADPYLEAERVFLTDARAISYAESCLGIVEHYRLGEIVGQPTAGTNGNVNPFTLPGGYRLSWTGMKVLKHDGSRHHGIGILPTVPVSRTIEGVRAGRDELLEAALELEIDGEGSAEGA